jgi:hypothetical protein
MLERLAQPLCENTLEASCMFGTAIDKVVLVPWSRMANPGRHLLSFRQLVKWVKSLRGFMVDIAGDEHERSQVEGCHLPLCALLPTLPTQVVMAPPGIRSSPHRLL